MKKKSYIQANTFTPIYDHIEDRIRLIVNYKSLNNRIDFMITRSFIIKFIYLLENYIENNFFINEFKQEAKNEQLYISETKQEYIDLVMKEELLQEANLTLLDDKSSILFVLSSKNIIVRAILNKELLQVFLENLKKSVPKYDWGISL